MVHLNRIYTKTGDQGDTAIGDGTRISKTNSRVVALGTVDELNAHLGMAHAINPSSQHANWILEIQNDLFDLGADLCTPLQQSETAKPALRVTLSQVEKLEGWIDVVNEKLSPLKSFVLPGGCPLAANLHLARTVCRRAERTVCLLKETGEMKKTGNEEETVNPFVLMYLNRLSDLLFVLSREANDNGTSDILWQPGEGR